MGDGGASRGAPIPNVTPLKLMLSEQHNKDFFLTFCVQRTKINILDIMHSLTHSLLYYDNCLALLTLTRPARQL